MDDNKPVVYSEGVSYPDSNWTNIEAENLQLKSDINVLIDILQEVVKHGDIKISLVNELSPFSKDLYDHSNIQEQFSDSSNSADHEISPRSENSSGSDYGIGLSLSSLGSPFRGKSKKLKSPKLVDASNFCEFRILEQTSSFAASDVNSKPKQSEITKAKPEEVKSPEQEDVTQLIQEKQEAVSQLALRDELLQKISVEASKLKRKYQEKSVELLEVSEKVNELEEVLTLNQFSSEETTIQFEECMREKEEIIVKLQQNLTDVHSKEKSVNDQNVKLNGEMESLKILNSQLNSTISRLKNELETVQSDCSHLKTQIETAKDKQQSNRLNNEKRDHEFHELKQKLQRETHSLQDEMEKNQTSSAKLHNEITKRKNETEQFQKQISDLNKLIQMKSSDITELEENHSAVVEELSFTKRLYDQLNGELNQLKITNHSQLLKYQQDLQNLEDHEHSLNTEIGDLKISNAQLRSALTSLQEDSSQSKELKTTLQQEAKDTKRELSLAKQNGQVLTEQIEKLNDTVQSLKEENYRVEKQIKEMENKSRHLEIEKHQLQEKLSFTEKSLHESHHESKDALSKFDIQSNEMRLLSTQLDEKATKVRKCEEIIRQLNEELQRAHDGSKDAMDKISELETNFVRTRSQKEELNKAWSEVQWQLDAKVKEMKQLTSQRETLIKEVENFRVRSNQSSEEISALQGHLAAQTLAVQHLQTTVQDLKADLKILKEEKKSALKESSSLNQQVIQLQQQLNSANQKQKAESSRWEERSKRLEAELIEMKREHMLAHAELQRKEELAKRWEQDCKRVQESFNTKDEEIESLDSQIRELKSQVLNVTRSREELEIALSENRAEIEQLRNEVSTARAQCREVNQEVAHSDEKMEVLQRSLYAAQDELTEKVQENVKLESSTRRYMSEMKSLEERCMQAEKELRESGDLIERLRKDFTNCKEEGQFSKQHILSFKQETHKTQIELESLRENQTLMTNQIDQQEKLLIQLQTELRAERSRYLECSKQLQHAKKEIADLHDELTEQKKKQSAAASKMNERETLLEKRQKELESLQSRLRELKQAIIEKEGLLKIAESQKKSSQKSVEMHTKEIQRFEDLIGQLQQDARTREEQHYSDQDKIQRLEEDLAKMRTQLNSQQGSHSELLTQVEAKAKDNLNIRTELSRQEAEVTRLSRELSRTESNLSRNQEDMDRLFAEKQELEVSETELQRKLQTVESEFSSERKRTKQQLKEVHARGEELKRTFEKVATLEEALHNKDKELDTSRADALSLHQEIAQLRLSLEESRANGERLHRESEIVIRNVNTWVNEQKNSHATLSDKIFEQTSALRALQESNERLEQQNLHLNNQLKRVKGDGKKVDLDKYKALQAHSAQQQSLLNQLKEQLEEYESERCESSKEVKSTVEELHERLKSKIDKIALLNQQLVSLQKENRRLREESEQINADYQSLRAQMDIGEIPSRCSSTSRKEMTSPGRREKSSRPILKDSHYNLSRKIHYADPDREETPRREKSGSVNQ